MSDQNSGARTWRSQGLHATVHCACPHCQAPGVYTYDESIRVGWPGCYVDPVDDRVGQPVGDTCPNCEASRKPTSDRWSPIKSLGEIWRRNFT